MRSGRRRAIVYPKRSSNYAVAAVAARRARKCFFRGTMMAKVAIADHAPAATHLSLPVP